MKLERFLEFRLCKGDKPRLCFMDDITHQYIDEHLALRTDNDPALFIAEQNKGARISPATPQEVIRNCRRKANHVLYARC